MGSNWPKPQFIWSGVRGDECVHRWMIVKRLQVGDVWLIIEKCRWCDVPLRRRKIMLNEDSIKTSPRVETESYQEVADNGTKDLGDTSTQDESSKNQPVSDSES